MSVLLRGGCLIVLALTISVAPLAAQTPEESPAGGADAVDWFTLRVPGTSEALLRAAGLPPRRPVTYLLADVARAMYEQRGTAARIAPVVTYLQGLRGTGEARGFDVPLPMAPSVWISAVFDGRATEARLAEAILTDARAALLYVGLVHADRAVAAFLAANPQVLKRLHREAAPAFALYSTSLHVGREGIRVPGGAAFEPFWRRMAGERPADAASFLLPLLTRDEGRLIAFFDLCAALDEPQAAFVLRSGERLYTFLKAYSAAQWMPTMRPRSALSLNPSAFFEEILIAASGTPVGPLARSFWDGVFALDDRDVYADRAAAARDPIDAAWLLERILIGPTDGRDARHRLDTFLFAQRVFGDISAETAGDTAAALRGFSRYPMLLLTFERIGIRDPRLHAAAVRHAGSITDGDSDRHRAAQAQLQGALALIERLVFSRALPSDTARILVADLIERNPTRGWYAGAIFQWLDARLLPALAPAAHGAGDDVDLTILEALAGKTSSRSPSPVVNWEGFQYRVDVAEAYYQRLRQVRVRQRPIAYTSLREIASLVALLRQPGLAAPVLRQAQERMAALAASLRRPQIDPLLNMAGRLIEETGERLGRLRLPADAGKVLEEAEALVTAVDTATGSWLQSLAYLPHIPDPNLPLLLDGDIAGRHDFFFEIPTPGLRRQSAWARPVVAPGGAGPWHVTGSLLGLDIALGHLALRKPSEGPPPAAAKWSEADREVMATAAALFNPFGVEADAHVAIASTLARGRAREAGLTTGRDSAGGALPDARVAAIRWTSVRDPESARALVGMSDLLRLGGIDLPRAVLDAWGAPAWPADSSLRLRWPAPRSWESLRWRPPAGAFSSHFPDIMLRMAELLAELKLPATLASVILPATVVSVLDGAEPAEPNDWGSVVEFVRRLRREQVEDHVAVQAAGGALIPVLDAADAR